MKGQAVAISFNTPDLNPFTPDFGQSPTLLIGRDALLARIGAGLSSGPRHPGFTTLLLGPRGSGKTAILNSVADAAKQHGWLVISVDSGTPDILERIGHALDRLEQLGATGLDDEAAGHREIVGVKLLGAGVNWAPRQEHQKLNNRYRLSHLAEKAAAHEAGVLLCVDEIHSGDRVEMRRLGGDIQHITKRESLPLALMGAGLGELRYGLLADRKMTFFQRCHREDVGLLQPEDVMHGIRSTVHSADGDLSDDALDVLLSVGRITPFHMQVIGSKMWTLAGAPDFEITDRAAREAVRLALPEVYEKIHEPAWYDMTPASQGFLSALAEFDGACDARDIIDKIHLSRKTYVDARRRLEYGGYIQIDDQSRIRATGLMPADSVLRLAMKDRPDGADWQDEDDGQANGRPASVARCGKSMKRVEGRCILPRDHSGGCRSRR